MIDTHDTLLRRLLRRLYLILSYPFVLGRFRQLERANERKHYPTRWLSSGELIREDLGYYDGPGSERFFSEHTLKELAQSRDKQSDNISNISRINFVALIFLIAQHLSIDMDVSILGISIKRAPGVSEALLVFFVVQPWTQCLHN